MPKTISEKYLNQLVNLYSQVLDSGEDLDHLLTTNKEQYAIDMNRKKVMSENSFKQHKVKLRALRKHSNVIENKYRQDGKGQYADWDKQSLREYSSTFLQFKPFKKVKEKPIVKTDDVDTPKIKKVAGSYYVAEIYDTVNKDSFWIKYNSQKSFERQLAKIKQSYKPKRFQIIDHGSRKYESFVNEEFKKVLANEGVEL